MLGSLCRANLPAGVPDGSDQRRTRLHRDFAPYEGAPPKQRRARSAEPCTAEVLRRRCSATAAVRDGAPADVRLRRALMCCAMQIRDRDTGASCAVLGAMPQVLPGVLVCGEGAIDVRSEVGYRRRCDRQCVLLLVGDELRLKMVQERLTLQVPAFVFVHRIAFVLVRSAAGEAVSANSTAVEQHIAAKPACGPLRPLPFSSEDDTLNMTRIAHDLAGGVSLIDRPVLPAA